MCHFEQHYTMKHPQCSQVFIKTGYRCKITVGPKTRALQPSVPVDKLLCHLHFHPISTPPRKRARHN